MDILVHTNFLFG